jgi:hypothetical protein
MNRLFLRIALAATSVAGIVFAWVEVAQSGHLLDVAEVATSLTLIAVGTEICGWFIGVRSPGRSTGFVLQAIGIAAPLGAARAANLRGGVPVMAAAWLAGLVLPALLLLGHPAGITRRRDRVVAAAAIGATIGLAVPIVLAAHGVHHAAKTWWTTDLFNYTATHVAWLLFLVHTIIAGSFITYTLTVSAQRYAASPRAERPMLRPVLIAGAFWGFALIATQLARLPNPKWALDPTHPGFTPGADFFLNVIPILGFTTLIGTVCWTELVTPRLTRTRSGKLNAPMKPDDVRADLARALASRDLRIVYRDTETDAWIDVYGKPVVLSVDSEHAVTVLERDGVELGVIEHDAIFASRPEALELVATAAGLAIESERLVALARRRAEQARRLTARFVTSTDTARDDLRIELLDGPVRELANIEHALENGAALDVVADRVQDVAVEVRRISHGLLPSELTERGLRGALPGSTYMPPGRYPPSVEITAYLAARNDPTASITDHGDHLTITLQEPTTDPLVLDRVAVLGGTVDATNVVLPCQTDPTREPA